MHNPRHLATDAQRRGKHPSPWTAGALTTLLILTLMLPAAAQAAGPTPPSRSLRSALAGEADDLPSPTTQPQVGYWYVVQPGDDIWLIAIAHGLSMDRLALVNGLKPPFWIHPGDRLWVPAKPAVVKRPTPQPTPTATPTPQLPATTAASQAPAAGADQPAVEATAPITAPLPAELPPPPVEAAPPAQETPSPAEAVAAAVNAETLPAPPEGTDPDAVLLFNLINEKRNAFGLPPYLWSPALAQAAQAHAEDCARRGWGSHVGSDGARLRVRYARVGYAASWASENWANASGPGAAFDMWWFEGPRGPHRLNILSPNYREVGIGVAKGRWGYYFVADFGTR